MPAEEDAPGAVALRMRVLEVLFLLSLLANGVVLALVVASNGKEAPSRSAFSIPASAGAAAPTARVATDAARLAAPDRRGPIAKAMIERRILAQIVRSPRAKLPAALVDARTGLAKNNLQVVCRRARVAHAFLCTIRLAGSQPGKQVYVRYGSGGGGLTWGRSR